MSVWKIEIYAKNNKKIKIYQTFLRFVANIFVIITLGIPMLQIYFSRDGITLSDLISKTRLRNIQIFLYKLIAMSPTTVEGKITPIIRGKLQEIKKLIEKS